MAYNVTNNELVGTPTTFPATLRMWPTVAQPKTVAGVSGAPLLARALPMAFNTSTNKWVVWTSGGANGTGTVSGFLMDPVQTHATDDSLAQMMLGGEIHFDDIPVPSGETSANLKTSLRSGPRGLGLTIVGLDQVH